jgi:hypothetical protein
MWEAPSLPYFCDSSLLPAPLPTTADIENAPCKLVERSCKVVRVGDHFVAKYGPQTRLRIQEGLNMIFVNQNLNTPIPSVYALYEENGNAYLLMQYVAGQTFEQLWPSLQPGERQMVLSKLRGILDDMRSLPPPSSPFYGSVDGGPLPYFLFWTPEPQKEVNGPFVTERDFCLGLVEKLVRYGPTINSTCLESNGSENIFLHPSRAITPLLRMAIYRKRTLWLKE